MNAVAQVQVRGPNVRLYLVFNHEGWPISMSARIADEYKEVEKATWRA